MEQTTVARSVEWRGTGLHSGRPALVAVRPADPDTGLVFRVAQAAGRPPIAIPAKADHVHSSTRATTLAAAGGQASVATVEHLLAALFALGIHNAWIDVEGGEVPALDGSAAPFAVRLRRAGRRRLAASRRSLAIEDPLEIALDDRWIRVEPAAALSIDYTIDFPHPAIGRQRHVVARLDRDVFGSTLAPARTFGFAAEVDRLRAQGLARGGDLANTLVLDGDGLLNREPLRFVDEFVRHKIVDLLGDLALLGGDLAARITVERGGHVLHHAMVSALVERFERDRARGVGAPPALRRATAQPA
ncbi:MAG: UDP-3-O-acyl-N-acetylglucosamine deacetylase [Myxococcota bacterium]